MNKLEGFLIKQLATNHNLSESALTEVIEGCNNPMVALEILLGIADGHNLPKTAKAIRGEANRTLLTVNRVNDTVHYKYNVSETRYKYNDTWYTRHELYYKSGIETNNLDEFIKDLEVAVEITSQVREGQTSIRNWTK